MTSPSLEEFACEVGAAPLAVDRVQVELVEAVPHGRGEVCAGEALQIYACPGHALALLAHRFPLRLLQVHEERFEVGITPVLPVVLNSPATQPALGPKNVPFFRRPKSQVHTRSPQVVPPLHKAPPQSAC